MLHPTSTRFISDDMLFYMENWRTCFYNLIRLVLDVGIVKLSSLDWWRASMKQRIGVRYGSVIQEFLWKYITICLAYAGRRVVFSFLCVDFKLNIEFMIALACNNLINHCIGVSLLIMHHGFIVIAVENFHICLFSLSTFQFMLRSIKFNSGRYVFYSVLWLLYLRNEFPSINLCDLCSILDAIIET